MKGSKSNGQSHLGKRFNGFLPVVVDVETGGLDPATDALLEIAAIIVEDSPEGLVCGDLHWSHVKPFTGAHIDSKALEINGIRPFSPLRCAISEQEAMQLVLGPICEAVKKQGCHHAILVGHNSFFDLAFLNAALARTGYEENPFHSFCTLDTVTLSMLAHRQSILARAVDAADIGDWDPRQAHSALYDCGKTAELFCSIFNLWDRNKNWTAPDLPPNPTESASD